MAIHCASVGMITSGKNQGERKRRYSTAAESAHHRPQRCRGAVTHQVNASQQSVKEILA